MIRGHSRPLNPKPEWEIRQVCPIRAFSLSRPSLTPSDKKLSLALRMVRVVKRLRLFVAFWLGIVGSMSIMGSLGEAPVSPVYPLSPVSSLNLRAKRTLLSSFHLSPFS